MPIRLKEFEVNIKREAKMKNLLRQLVSFILPIFVLIIMPLIIIHGKIPGFNIWTVIGIIIICAGLSFMIMTISAVIRTGKGTLAPWSPTKKLVIEGLYKYLRNPMILGVLIVLMGETIALLSWKILIWTVVFFVINQIYLIVSEEPGLEKRFGNEYIDYKKKVPRWIPHLKMKK
jgi:protein-S-isoprenylcysteine O-methyltransferase Ste14